LLDAQSHPRIAIRDDTRLFRWKTKATIGISVGTFTSTHAVAASRWQNHLSFILTAAMPVTLAEHGGRNGLTTINITDIGPLEKEAILRRRTSNSSRMDRMPPPTQCLIVSRIGSTGERNS